MITTIPVETLVLAVALFVALLFSIAFFAERTKSRWVKDLVSSPAIYTLSIAVYCTSWTFYGAVGSASRSGLEYLTIYLGPTIVFVGWWFFLRRIVFISNKQRLTSIADFVSSRFGKSVSLGAIMSVIAVIAITPYIALQLKAVSTSFDLLVGTARNESGLAPLWTDSALWIALTLSAFAIVFGTGKISADEQHDGVVAAIAFESLFKLIALLLIGGFVIFSVAGGFGAFLTSAETAPFLDKFNQADADFLPRWTTLLVLAASAIICLPRQFQVTAVEAKSANHLRLASWLFPLYLLLISLSVIPIAVVGQAYLPEGSNPDLFVLTLPLSQNQTTLALLAFLGGFSSATSMVIISSVALSIMVSNHLILPLFLRASATDRNRDSRLVRLILVIRRLSILAIIVLGYLYHSLSSGSGGLASIGLISFAGVAQFLPALAIGLLWRNATKIGAIVGTLVGASVWLYTLLLPSLGVVPPNVPAWIAPDALFGLKGLDPLVHTTFWSLTLNALSLAFVSTLTSRSPLERLQAALFVDMDRYPGGTFPQQSLTGATSEDLYIIAQRIMGHERAYRLFHQNDDGQLIDVTPEFVMTLERELASNVGAASARTLISHVTRGELVGIDEVIEILDETQQVVRYSQELEAKSKLLAETATQLQKANDQLKELDTQKDDFLSRVSHELRTPMTSIRSFSEILTTERGLSSKERGEFLGIIMRESERLTRLLDRVLDLSRLENGAQDYELAPIEIATIIDRALDSLAAPIKQNAIATEITQPKRRRHKVLADADALQQVLVNLLSNAIKYNDSAHPTLLVSVKRQRSRLWIDIVDNGPGIPKDQQVHIFSKFGRSWRQDTMKTKGTGLGLAISREIVSQFGGELTVNSELGKGACFRIDLPLAG